MGWGATCLPRADHQFFVSLNGNIQIFLWHISQTLTKAVVKRTQICAFTTAGGERAILRRR